MVFELIVLVLDLFVFDYDFYCYDDGIFSNYYLIWIILFWIYD